VPTAGLHTLHYALSPLFCVCDLRAAAALAGQFVLHHARALPQGTQKLTQVRTAGLPAGRVGAAIGFAMPPAGSPLDACTTSAWKLASLMAREPSGSFITQSTAHLVLGDMLTVGPRRRWFRAACSVRVTLCLCLCVTVCVRARVTSRT
jgi:hypothetical protein